MSKAAELAALIGSQTALSNRNLIINGAMQVAQRGTSLTVGDSTEYKTLDRFAIGINGTTAGRATMSQATDAPSGFGNSMKFDVTTADTSIGANEAFGFLHRIEGQNLQQFAKGTADAKVCTLSFYAKGTAKTYVVETRDANSRQVSATFNVTTSWQRFEITIPADTAGTIANDNSTGLTIIWWLHAGSDFTSGTLNTSWAASVNANRMVGCESIFSSTSNELFITGVQLEVGETATPFEHRSFGEELALCQRYFCKSYNYDIAPGASGSVNNLKGAASFSGGTSTSNRPFWSAGQYPVTMRSEPTIVLYHYDGTSGKITGGSFASYDGTATNIGDRGFNAHPTGNVSNSDDEDHYLIFTASAELQA